MKYKPLPSGADHFEKLITRGYYYVDKTLLIQELLDKKGDVNLFTRPRRFGKTLNMSMLQCFFEDRRDDNGVKQDHSSLFEGLQIMQAAERYLSHMGQYPVISLSLKSSRQPDFSSAYRMLARQIAQEFWRHRFVMQGDMIQEQKDRYEELMWEKADRESFTDSLRFLSECLEKYYGKKTVIFIDEYDVPLDHAFSEGYYDEMACFIRSLYESAFKSNTSLEFAVITGCTCISKQSIFMGMNNLKIITIRNRNFDEYYGFTGQEVKKICTDFGLEHKIQTVREWYGGYIFGNAHVCNPWSVICFIEDMLADDSSFPSPYWANTSENSIVRTMIERADNETKQELEILMEGKAVEKPVYEDITYDGIYNSVSSLWNYMFFSGYFRKEAERMDENLKQVFAAFAIPNEEVRLILRTKILAWFEEKIKTKNRTSLFQAFLDHDIKALEAELIKLLAETVSFNDAYESFYHAFLASVFSGIKGYLVKSNREGGSGRSDLYIIPLTRKKEAFVIEFKTAQRFRDLEPKAMEALKQMKDRQYAGELIEDGYARVCRYGIAFYKKDCLVIPEVI